jgi:N-methylhydantoinase A
VTDANLVLGRLPGTLAGGLELDRAAAELALGDFDPQAVVDVVNAEMLRALRLVSVERGHDPRDFALVAFGGAGPLHGAEVAAMLEIPEVIVPVYPGITSALGLLTTDLKYDAIKTEFQVRGSVDLPGLNEDFHAMEAGLAGQFTADGLAPSEVSFTRWADLRYVGQGYELRVAMPAGAVAAAGLEGAWQRFHELHHAEYGQSFPSSPIEIVNIRVSGVGRMPRIGALRAPRGTSLAKARVKTGRCVFRVNGALTQLDTAFYRRDRLPVDEIIAGPAIILQADSTTLIPPGSSARADRAGNLLIAIGGSHE